ncbi:uncharacterized protein BDR25DRAFT_211187, partial [Lindgomyces ingoldianus]
MNDRRRLGTVISSCLQFFRLHSECSIPQLKYVFATTLAGCYDDLGDIHHALHWRVKAKEIAQETDDRSIQEEAEYQIQMTLASTSVKAADDPHGVKQREWELAQRADLEVKYQESKEGGSHEDQYAYAFDLLQKELDDEIKRNESPCGRIWLSKVNEALELIPDRKTTERPRITFTIAHSKFDFGEFDSALETLVEAYEEASAAGNDEIARRALFTKTRVYLHQY